MKAIKTVILCLVIFASHSSFAQYAKVSFKAKTPFRIVVDDQNIHEGHTDEIKLRLNQERSYTIKCYEKKTDRLMYEGQVGVEKREKSANYKLHYKKKKDIYQLVELSKNIKPAPGSQKMSFSMETHESYSGPDGAYSKGQKTEGTLGKGGLNYKQQKGNAKVDKDGLSAKAEENSGAIPGIGAVGKLFKKKKKDDGQTVVVLKIKKA